MTETAPEQVLAKAPGQALPRVQRVPSEWPILHLEAETPSWDGLVVDGLVRHPGRFDLPTLESLGAEHRAVPVHCVWGWSRTDGVWEGISLGHLLDVVEPATPTAEWVTVSSSSGTYSSCLPLADAIEGMLVWGRDREPLTSEAGGPLRFLTTPAYWAYKGVKWAGRITLSDRFSAGFWESKVGDPTGLIGPEVVRP